MTLMLVMWAAPARSQQMPLRYFTQQDGLSNLSVSAMANDRDGYIWIGTENGLFRYNGTEFRRYSREDGLPEPFIAALHVDAQNRLWVANNNTLYLRKGERFESVFNDGKKVPISAGQKLSSSPDGRLFFVSQQSLYALTMSDGQPQLTVLFPSQQNLAQTVPDALFGLHLDKNGDFWLGCGQSICEYSGTKVRVWDVSQGVPDDRWHSFYRDSSGQLWARGEQHIAVLPANDTRFKDRTPPGDILHKKGLVIWISADAEGRVLTNADQSLIRWNKDRWESFDKQNGLKIAGGLTGLLFDKDGGMWLGSRGLGLIKWLGSGNWESWTMAQGMPDDVALSLVRDRAGVLHVGTRSGPAQLGPDQRHFSTNTDGLGKIDHQWSGMVVDNSGTVWGGTYSGQLMRFDAKTRIYTQVATLPQIYRMLSDSKGNIWVTTANGLFVIDTSISKINVMRPAGLDSLKIPETEIFRDLCQSPNGNIWVLSRRQLLRFNGKSWNNFQVKFNGEPPNMAALSCAGDNGLWLGTVQAGLIRAGVKDGVLQLQQQESPVLKNKLIFSLLEDNRGWLWVGTDAGIAVWNKKQWRLFNQSNGFVWNETNGRSFYEDPDGAMWVATSNGISHILKPERLFKEHELNSLIESIHRGGESFFADRPMDLAWSPQPLEFVLVSLNFRNRGALEFHYRLAGLEKSWSTSTTPRVRYTALEPGNYRFEYFVSNSDAQQSSAIKYLELVIQPPWWRTVWFYILVGAVCLILVFVIHTYRLRKLTELQAQTEAIVKERTRELELSREELKIRALRDGLTSAWNRSAMLEILEMELVKAARQKTFLLLVLLDLDHFKRINDTYGHPAGDAVLVEVVRRLNATVRQYDAVGRYGGEEFLIIIPGLDLIHGKSLVERLLQSIREQNIVIGEQQSISVTSSFGVIAFDPYKPMTSAELISHADQALYRSKQQGRDRVEYVV
ncbi:diguanylate cyclase [Undibacterium sp. CY18W]|uniref:diguanylate cyclase n=1 Tax=Undibacterium hunanense TaxID=2762292 RepID=A0ABR6ZN71_9BURK|nr:ligand-binding sensor domain-containing diguanylate cyclase [Undibacterium hunanense]MBC3917307.1 diguanylate cyclase [Undibacterium hunanense]